MANESSSCRCQNGGVSKSRSDCNCLALGRKGWILLLTLFIGVFVFDRVTKIWAFDWLRFHSPISVIPGFFSLRYAQNTGIAFGLMSRYGTLVQWMSPFVFVALVYFFIKSVHFHGMYPNWRAISIGMVIGGALGNLYDRVVFQYVIDFLDVYLGSYHWPTFNVADSFICIGVGILLILAYKTEKLPVCPPES